MRAGPHHWLFLLLMIAVGLSAAHATVADADALASADPAARAAAAIRIAQAGQCSDVELHLLISLLADPAVAASAATAPAAAAASGQPTVGDRAADALSRLGAPAVEAMVAALDDPSRRDVHGPIVNLLGRMAPIEAAPAVLRYVKRHIAARQPWDVGMSVAWLGRDAAAALVQALDSNVLELQVVAAKDLGYMGDPRALAPLLSVARRLAPLAATMPADYKQRRRIIVFRAAVPSIAMLGGARSFEQIRQWQAQLAGSWDVATQQALIVALAYTGDERAIPILLALLGGDDRQDRRTAADALAFLAHPASLPALIAATTDADPIVRANTATALGALADIAAVDPLIDLLTDPTPEVRGRAAAALAGIAEVDLGLDPIIWRHWRDEHRKALAETHPAPATPPVTGGP